jgi:hypothetical protein
MEARAGYGAHFQLGKKPIDAIDHDVETSVLPRVTFVHNSTS